MFNQRKADKIDNALDDIMDHLMAMGVNQSVLKRLLAVHHEIVEEFERLANDRNPFED